MSELCLRSGISRKTGYKWLRRYLEGGEQRLDDLPKRPHHSPNRTSDDMEQLVVDLRREHPTKGGHVLARILKDRGHNRCRPRARSRPSSDVEPSESLKHKPYKRFGAAQPAVADGLQGAYPCRQRWTLPPAEDDSRLGVRACADERTQTGPSYVHLQPYGMPNTILVDNGSPQRRTVWLVQLGVRVVHSRPTTPRPSASSSASTGPSSTELLLEADTPLLPEMDGESSRPGRLPADTPSPRPFPETLPTVDYADDQVRSEMLGRSFPAPSEARGSL